MRNASLSIIHHEHTGAAARRVSEPQQSGLTALDGRLQAAATGVVLVQVVEAGQAEAVRHHVVRRGSRLPERRVLSASVALLDGCFRDLALRMGVPALDGDPRLAARQLAEASVGTVAVIEGDFEEGSWDAQVLVQLGLARYQGLLVLISTAGRGELGAGVSKDVLVIQGESREDARVWWDAVVEAVMDEGPPGSLSALERWWSGSGRLPARPAAHADTLSLQARALLARLVAAGRSWPAASMQMLGTVDEVEELAQLGLLRREQSFWLVDRPLSDLDTDADSLRQVADALASAFPSDPWALVRASALLMDVQDLAQAETLLDRAIATSGAIALRREAWRRWLRHVAAQPAALHRSVVLRAAHVALSLDDVDAALELAGEARRGLPEPPFEAALVIGRAQLARGDVLGAQVTLRRARELAGDPRAEAEAMVVQADAAFWDGDFDGAIALVSGALQSELSPATRLKARNVRGKVLLARAAWNEAEASFAADEMLAWSEQLHDGALRARVNRAVALLSDGRLDAARRILEAVREEGRQRRHPRPIAFALSNLAVVAHLEHRYAEALDLYQRAIEACHELGDRLGLTRPACNLAELRLELGLVDEAEQALRFAQRMLSAGVPASIATQMLFLDAEIHLERAQSTEATRSAREALAQSSRCTHGGKTGDCHRLIARIALQDGNVPAVADALAQSEKHLDGSRARAEHAWLEARLARAKGLSSCLQDADRAASLARQAEDRELQRATSVLLAEISMAEDEPVAARNHLRTAQRILREMTRGLPESLIRAVHQRRDIRTMQELAWTIEQQSSDAGPSSHPPPPSATREAHPAFVGSHPRVQRLMAMVQRVAGNSNAPVLVHGESGTGKELIAEALHRCSDRRDKPLIKVNCAALVETLLLSELFGHEKGAFTGAAARRRGRFELADGGVLFLDEIGDISPRTQVALLRVLQDGTFERVGGGAPLHTDVRVVCATHRDLSQMVAAGRFREDLYYRLCGVVLEVPPLRERGDDIRRLAEHFLDEIAEERKEPVRTLSPEAVDVLTQHSWPGNVRELANVLRAATLFADGLLVGPGAIRDQLRSLGTDHAPDPLPASGVVAVGAQTPGGPADASLNGSDPTAVAYELIRQGQSSLTDLKRRIERECILRALDETDGNITRAASLLGMKRPRLSQIVKELGLQKSASEQGT